MHPLLQQSVLDQVETRRLVGMDSMNLWIETTPNELRDVLGRVNIVKIDDSEARELAGVYNLRRAAAGIQSLGPDTPIAPRGGPPSPRARHAHRRPRLAWPHAVQRKRHVPRARLSTRGRARPDWRRR